MFEEIDYEKLDEQTKGKIKADLLKKFSEYQTFMSMLGADGPIEILCLPKTIEKILLRNGCVRVYDLFNMDFTKIKGLGIKRIGHLTTCLDQLFPMR